MTKQTPHMKRMNKVEINKQLQYNLHDSNTDGSFTMANSNSCFSP